MINKRHYTVLNSFFIALYLFLLLRTILNIEMLHITFSSNVMLLFFSAALLFMVAHIFKCSRFYLILFESRIEIKRFVKLYIKTTFVNILLPLKLGEIFRIYTFGKDANSYKTGFLSVLTDRYFDTCILLLIIIPFDLMHHSLSLSSILLLFFIILITFAYLIFSPTYQYLNEYIILNKSSKHAIKTLELLERCKMIYDHEKRLLKGRTSAIILFSVLAWVIEFLMLFTLGKGLGLQFGANNLVDYLNSALFITGNDYLTMYTLIGAIIFGLIILVIYSILFLKKGSVGYGK
ncbi:Lysylphosphatidylglycerol synthase TM region [Paenibacillus sp. GP183]|nr:Lysylphosphatidylglycerol synthase TM region [Paenibacillus sp. GP183]